MTRQRCLSSACWHNLSFRRHVCPLSACANFVIFLRTCRTVSLDLFRADWADWDMNYCRQHAYSGFITLVMAVVVYAGHIINVNYEGLILTQVKLDPPSGLFIYYQFNYFFHTPLTNSSLKLSGNWFISVMWACSEDVHSTVSFEKILLNVFLIMQWNLHLLPLKKKVCHVSLSIV